MQRQPIQQAHQALGPRGRFARAVDGERHARQNADTFLRIRDRLQRMQRAACDTRRQCG